MRRLVHVIFVFAACGDDGNRHIIDAPRVPDGAPEIDAAPQPVTVTVTRDGAPVTGIQVYFQNTDATVAGMPMTDTTGTASAVVAAGGTVTVVDTSAPRPGVAGYTELTTWLAVRPGDHLRLSTANPPTIFVSFTVPTDANHGTINSYSLYASCSSSPGNQPYTQQVAVGSGAPASVVFADIPLRGCNGTADILVVANDLNNEPASSFYVPAQTVADAGSLDLTAQANNYVATTQHTYHVDHFTSAAALVITDWQASNRGVVFGHDARATGDPIDTIANLPTWSGALRYIELFEAANGGLTDRHYVEWGNLDPFTTDYSAHLLPDFTAGPVLDTSTHAVAWTQSGGSLAPDFAVSSVFANRVNDIWIWNLVGPGPSSLQLPVLPAGSFDYNIGATDSFTAQTVSTGKAPGGYDGVRAGVFAATGPQSFIAGTSGSLIANTYQPVLAVARQRPARSWFADPVRATAVPARAPALFHRGR